VDGVTPRIQLAIDACAGPASVALFIDDVLVQSRRIDRQGSAELLAPTIAEVMHAARYAPRGLTHVIVGGGPGSFTGLRVAAALGKGLARGSGAALLAVPSLALIAAADADASPGRYCCVLDALRGEWYVQSVTKHGDHTWTVDGAVERLAIDEVRTRAAGWNARLVGPPIDTTMQPDARAALRIGAVAVHRDSWEPDYGRLAEAQVQWEATHARALPTA
jgi:tRNA threonylcarbamoyladenosine biosynthesis protein TsaB